jgi:acetone carboxylase, alpha subunit
VRPAMTLSPEKTTTLRDKLAESERLFETTGRYQGIDDLEIARTAPMEYERLHSRLLSTVISTRETVKHIAASPGTKEVGEFVIALYTPEGEAITLSTGIMVHVHTLSEFIKFMIRNGYEDNPGVRQGDIFENNESWAGGVHTPDVQTVTPIIHDGELVGWVGSVTHELDVGTSEGGGMCLMSPERFSEGLHVSAEKVGEDDDLRADYLIRLRMNLRNADWWILDSKSKIAGMVMVREAVQKVIDEFGLDFYKQATRELIEENRRQFQRRVRRTLVPGRYRATHHQVFRFANEEFVHPFSRRDMGQVVPIEINVGADGSLAMDFEGASRWDFHPYNCTPSSMNGGLWITLVQVLAYDGKVNDGAYLAVKQNLPKGSVVNTDYPAAGTSLAWFTLIPLYSDWVRLMSTAFFARGFLEEVFQCTPSELFQAAGLDPYDRPFGVTNFELAAGSSGARATWDGIDHSHQLWNPEAVSGDMEIWEFVIPKLYLTRTLSKDRHGMGRFRAGTTWEALYKVHNTKMLSVILGGVEQGGAVFQKGLFGGYPNPGPRFFFAQGTNLGEIIEGGGDVPGSIAECEQWLDEGRLTADRHRFTHGPLWTPALTAATGDLVGLYYTGGAGYGDPLDRQPHRVVDDLSLGILSAEFAEKAYGVVVRERAEADGTTWEVDDDATRRVREQRRQARLDQSEPVSEWWKRQRNGAREASGEPAIVDLYQKSAVLSDKIPLEYKAFWQIEDWPY